MRRRRRATGPCAVSGAVAASAASGSRVAAVDVTAARGAGGRISEDSCSEALTPVMTASRRAPPASRSSSGRRIDAPRNRARSKLA
ncbi:hypothetical protein RhoFasK5_02768|nr:hypothetical protein [Rhodococcus kroppenstedtii]